MLTVITPAPTKDLTTLATVKAELQITSSAQDDHLTRLISEASETLAEACNRVFGRETVKQTERIDIPVGFIILDRDINPAVTSVTVNGTALAPTEYELDEYRLYRIMNDRRYGWFAYSKVEITYQAGFTLLTDLPRPLERACIDLVVSTYQARGRDAGVSRIQTEGVGAVSYFDMKDWQGGFPANVQAVVDRWRRVPV